MKIAITGASGFLGRPLMAGLIEQGHRVIAVCRKRAAITELPPEAVFEWDALRDDFPAGALSGTDSIVHLAGDPIANGRWSADKRRRIRDSRIIGTRKLVDCIAAMDASIRPKSLISGSAIGIYGDRADETLTELSVPGAGFLADVTEAWERESARAAEYGLRLVRLRTGIVLSRNGGALPKMPPLVLGNGRQWMSWIHFKDWERIAFEAATSETFAGDYNVTAPAPVTNAQFVESLRKVKKFPFRAAVPSFALTMALGEMASMLLASQRVIPERLVEAGFRFEFEGIVGALDDLFRAG